MNINEMIENYLKAKETEKAAKKESEYLKDMILLYAGQKNAFNTESYNIIIKTQKRTSIDTERLYKDFPEMKQVYGKTTEFKIITAIEKQESKKTA